MSNSDTPQVSVCIPTYNKREALREALDAVLRQTVQDLEVLICDDGSEDGTWEYLSSLNHPKVRVFRNERNLNLPKTLKRLFDAARGDFIAMQHDHEPPYPHWLERMVAVLRAHPRVGFACCAYAERLEHGSVRRNLRPFEYQLFGPSRIIEGKRLIDVLTSMEATPISASGTLFRREVVERAGGYRTEWGIASDEDLYRRVAAIADVAFWPEELFEFEARPRDRLGSLGQWRATFTVAAFREQTIEDYLQAGPLTKTARLAAIRLMKYRRVSRELLSAWLGGNEEMLKRLPEFERVPVEAVDSRTMNGLVWPAIVGVATGLAASADWGRRVGTVLLSSG